jgi:tyrosyl-tRNA synthetase
MRVHGADHTRQVEAAAAVLFGGGELREADASTLAVVAREVVTVTVPRSRLDAGIGVADALLECGLASSKADARRGIQGGGYSVNGERVAGFERMLGAADVLAGRYIALQKGRRNFALLVID